MLPMEQVFARRLTPHCETVLVVLQVNFPKLVQEGKEKEERKKRKKKEKKKKKEIKLISQQNIRGAESKGNAAANSGGNFGNSPR
jgi:hypothetical protein